MKIRNWKKFQHFKDRRPPWIKLYRDLLDDPDWHDLEPIAAKVLTMLWLLASEDETQEGLLPDTRKIAFRLRMSEDELKQTLTKLSKWLDQGDVKAISDRCHNDINLDPQRQRQRQSQSQRQKDDAYPFSGNIVRLNQRDFDRWTKAYPNLDLLGELEARDQWLKSQPEHIRKKWFESTSKYLANRNIEAKAKLANPHDRPALSPIV